MSFKSIRFMWARKLLKAKFFVVMTDKESAICIDGADPESFNDDMALAAQTAEIQAFKESLEDLCVRHQNAIAKLKGYKTEETTIVPKKAPLKPKRIRDIAGPSGR